MRKFMWAEHFDRDLTDIFDLQDEITAKIASRVAPTLRRSEIDRANSRRTSDFDVWDLYLRMLRHYHQVTKKDWLVAIELCADIKSRAADFAPAYYYSALLAYYGAVQGYFKATAESWQHMLRDSEQGVMLAGDDFAAHAMLTLGYAYSGNHDGALQHGQRAFELNLYAPQSPFALGVGLWINGRHEEACGNFEECLRRGTNDPDRCHWAATSAFSYYSLHNYDAALSWADQCLMLVPTHRQVLGCRAATLALLGRQEEAKSAIARFRENAPHATAGDHVKNFGWHRQEDIDHYRGGLIKAGLPE